VEREALDAAVLGLLLLLLCDGGDLLLHDHRHGLDVLLFDSDGSFELVHVLLDHGNLTIKERGRIGDRLERTRRASMIDDGSRGRVSVIKRGHCAVRACGRRRCVSRFEITRYLLDIVCGADIDHDGVGVGDLARYVH